MIKVFIVVFSSTYNLEKITAHLDKNAKITFWFRNLPNSLFIKTSLTSKELYEYITKEFGEDRMFIAPINGDTFGRLPETHWQYFK